MPEQVIDIFELTASSVIASFQLVSPGESGITLRGPTGPPGAGSAGNGWRFVDITGPPKGIKLQVLNGSSVWEDVWEYTAST